MAEGPSAVSGHLQALLTKAQDHCFNQYSDTVTGLYRNKSADYFDKLKDNIMEPYLKDHGGDPRCPINGILKGLFFGVTLWNGELPTISPYGKTRVVVPLERLFNDSARLYFADFYCMKGQKDNHYVTLVLTKPYTEAYRFCQKYLIRLDERANVFLRKEESTYETLRQDKLWVEVLYTDEVDISGLKLTETGGIGKGSSTGGISKTPGCKICNEELSDKELSRQKTLLKIDVLQLEKELSMLQ